jgi:hypothetical protein
MNDIKSGGRVLNFGSIKGKWFYDGRISLSVLYFESLADAELIAKEVKEQGCSYNGGWFDGMPCGREPARDYLNEGIKWYAVTC